MRQRNIGLTICFACVVVYTRTAFLAPTKAELNDPQIAESNRAWRMQDDKLGMLHDLRYYVLGVGALGLLIALEDLRDKPVKEKDPENRP
jgi:hypothetical protein